MKAKQRVYYYEDPLKDDFAGTKIKKRPLPKKYKYVRKNPIWVFFSFLIYYVIAVPIFWLVSKIGWGVKVYGRKNLLGVWGKGFYAYGNHTMIADAWIFQCMIAPGRRSYIVADQDATSMPAVRWLVEMLGCLPVPETPEERGKFLSALEIRTKQRAGIVIYPEQHIWPYATHIRPFTDESFVYPADSDCPVVPFCTTFRKRKVFKNLSPRMTVHVGKPIYADKSLSMAERKKDLRDQVYNFMIRHSAEDENVEWIRYEKKKPASKGE